MVIKEFLTIILVNEALLFWSMYLVIILIVARKIDSWVFGWGTVISSLLKIREPLAWQGHAC